VTTHPKQRKNANTISPIEKEIVQCGITVLRQLQAYLQGFLQGFLVSYDRSETFLANLAGSARAAVAASYGNAGAVAVARRQGAD
jgi:hypothetical protein